VHIAHSSRQGMEGADILNWNFHIRCLCRNCFLMVYTVTESFINPSISYDVAASRTVSRVHIQDICNKNDGFFFSFDLFLHRSGEGGKLYMKQRMRETSHERGKANL
jgi:hypothetical protein